ncbi:MAG: TraB/GumN family protein [Kiritimatiellae bacterium]|nr:TraB/GumN family protein [Kiritimatiellia bacterium]
MSRPARRSPFRLLASVGLCALTVGATEPPPPRALAWIARKGDAVLHLIGTVHAGEAASPWPDEVEWCWRATTALAVEANISDEAAIRALTRRYGFTQDPTATWGEHWNPALQQRLRNALGELPPDAHHMRPWLVAQSLVVAHLVREGFHPDQGLDARLIRRAYNERRPIIELEGVERQLRIFADAPPDIQIAMLIEALEDIESGEAAREIRRIVTACNTGDLAALETLFHELSRRNRAADRYLFRRLFAERHPEMIRAIERAAEGGERPLIAVGALHFVGPDGLPAMLGQRGWRVERLSAPRVPVSSSAP